MFDQRAYDKQRWIKTKSSSELLARKKMFQDAYLMRPGVKGKTAATHRARNIRRAYGITIKQWNDLFDKQGSRCAICGSPNPKRKTGWHTDHCHTTGKIRGILCHSCNLAIGHAGDNTIILERMVVYLKNDGGSSSLY